MFNRKLNIYDLYVAQIGQPITENSHYIRFKPTGEKVILKENKYNETFINVLNGTEYYDFNYNFVTCHSYCIYHRIPLSSIINIEQSKKILKDGNISIKYLRELYLMLNNDIIKYNQNVDPSINELPNLEKNNDNKSLPFIPLNKKKYLNEPAIGRERELKELFVSLAQDKKNPILVGPSGVGKTSIVDELVYKIQHNQVPSFLKNNEIIEVNVSDLTANTKYRGELENNVKNIINYSLKSNSILFIDEIHNIIGAGATTNDNIDIANILKYAIDRQGLKIIGTTTDIEYDKYFANDALKRRFDKIDIKEPTDNILFSIIKKVFNNYSLKNKISISNIDEIDSIIDELINLTRDKHRIYNDKMNNPDLVISIIDKIFADAKINNQTELNINNIIYGIGSCNRIYDSCKEESIRYLKSLKPKTLKKVIKFD